MSAGGASEGALASFGSHKPVMNASVTATTAVRMARIAIGIVVSIPVPLRIRERVARVAFRPRRCYFRLRLRD